jgi:hypothetical protein
MFNLNIFENFNCNNFQFFLEKYLIFLIDYSFIERNHYIDSNYYLTSDATKGIEKFSDLSLP